jgi:hypothetical protein
LMKN